MLKTKPMNSSPTISLIPWCQTFTSRPALKWKSFLLCQSQMQPVLQIDVQDAQIYTILFELYSDKNLSDIFELLLFFQKQGVNLTASDLAKAYGFFWSEAHEVLLKLYPYWPEKFKIWSQAKQLQMNDLRPLLLIQKPLLSKDDFLLSFLQSLAQEKVSRSEGKILLELGIDLYLLKQPEDSGELLGHHYKNPAAWIKQLKKYRYPMTESMDEAYKNFVSQSKWPIDCQFKRVGDKKGFLFSFLLSSKSDISKTQAQLEQSFDKVLKFYKDQKL